MSEYKLVRYGTAFVQLPEGEYTREELQRLLAQMDAADAAMKKLMQPPPCPVCHGVGYDSSGQRCEECSNPSF